MFLFSLSAECFKFHCDIRLIRWLLAIPHTLTTTPECSVPFSLSYSHFRHQSCLIISCQYTYFFTSPCSLSHRFLSYSMNLSPSPHHHHIFLPHSFSNPSPYCFLVHPKFSTLVRFGVFHLSRHPTLPHSLLVLGYAT